MRGELRFELIELNDTTAPDVFVNLSKVCAQQTPAARCVTCVSSPAAARKYKRRFQQAQQHLTSTT
jgi:hypothetical protein